MVAQTAVCHGAAAWCGNSAEVVPYHQPGYCCQLLSCLLSPLCSLDVQIGVAVWFAVAAARCWSAIIDRHSLAGADGQAWLQLP